MKFENKVVLVTGSSRGIGKATALMFAKEGAKIVVNCNESKQEGENTIQEVKKISPE